MPDMRPRWQHGTFDDAARQRLRSSSFLMGLVVSLDLVNGGW